MFQEDYGVIEKRIVKTQKKLKNTKEELQHVLDNKRRATTGSPRTMEKIKNIYEIGEGLEQRRKSGEDIKSQKFMQGNAR
jgi:hypothetical protein